MIEQVVGVVTQMALVLFLSPLIAGFIRTLKARLQTRRGPSVLQPYRDLYKLWRKGMVIPETASWIFTTTPYVLFATTLLAGLLIPAISAQAPLSLFGGVLAVVYLLALGRFFLALGGLDTGRFVTVAVFERGPAPTTSGYGARALAVATLPMRGTAFELRDAVSSTIDLLFTSLQRPALKTNCFLNTNLACFIAALHSIRPR